MARWESCQAAMAVVMGLLNLPLLIDLLESVFIAAVGAMYWAGPSAGWVAHSQVGWRGIRYIVVATSLRKNLHRTTRHRQ